MRNSVAALSFAVLLAGAVPQAQAADEHNDCYKATAAKDKDKAIAVCTRLIDSGRWKGANQAILLNNRALAYIAKKEFDPALKDLDQAVQLNSKYRYAYYNRGEVWRMRGNFERAIVEYSHAIRVEPEDLLAYVDRGLAYEAVGNRSGARADYQTALAKPGLGRPNDKWAKATARKRLEKLGKDN